MVDLPKTNNVRCVVLVLLFQNLLLTCWGRTTDASSLKHSGYFPDNNSISVAESDKLTEERQLYVTSEDLTNETCRLELANASTDFWVQFLEKHEHSFINVNLEFLNTKDVSSTDNLLQPTTWILMRSYGVVNFMKWSFVFPLLIKNFLQPYPHVTLYLNATPANCKVALGTNSTTLAIQNAITIVIQYVVDTLDKPRYAFTKWCYSMLNDNFTATAEYKADLALGWDTPLGVYKCIETIYDWNSKSVKASLGDTLIDTDDILTLGSTLISLIVFIYMPLCLVYVYPLERTEMLKSDVTRTQIEREMTSAIPTKQLNKFVYLNGEPPISFSNYCLSLFGLEHNNPVLASRTRRLICHIFSPIVLYVYILLSALQVSDYTKEALRHKSAVGFIAILSPDMGARAFVPYFGGPMGMFIIYFFLGLLFLVFPKDIESILRWNLNTSTTREWSPFALKLETIQDLSSLNMVDANRRSCLSVTVMANFRMVWRPSFWHYVTRIQVKRCLPIYSMVRSMYCRTAMITMCICLCLPPYICFCVVELFLCGMYNGFPFINFTILVCFTLYANIKRNLDLKCNPFCICFLVVSLVAFATYYYIFGMLAVHSVAFLVKTSMCILFTVIAYPSEYFGYVFFGPALLFYVYKLLSRVGEEYTALLIHITDICSRLELQPWQIFQDGTALKLNFLKGCGFNLNPNVMEHVQVDKKEEAIQVVLTLPPDQNFRKEPLVHKDTVCTGVSCSLFDLVVKKHKPLHIETFKTALNIGLIISILLFTVWIASEANNSGQLSDAMHIVFIVVIGALPHFLDVAHAESTDKVRKAVWLKEVELSIQEFVQENNHMSQTEPLC